MALVYVHIRKDTHTIFYIGIGKSKRRMYCIKDRNIHWTRIVNKVGYECKILFEDLTWEEAISKEIELIKKHGRADLGTGTLVNMTDGVRVRQAINLVKRERKSLV